MRGRAEEEEDRDGDGEDGVGVVSTGGSLVEKGRKGLIPRAQVNPKVVNVDATAGVAMRMEAPTADSPRRPEPTHQY